MKVGDIFELPENVLHIVGRQGRIKNEDETKILAKYEVVLIETEKKLDKPNSDGDRIELVKEFKGRVIVTYGNKRKNS